MNKEMFFKNHLIRREAFPMQKSNVVQALEVFSHTEKEEKVVKWLKLGHGVVLPCNPNLLNSL